MDISTMDDEEYLEEDDGPELLINFPPEVQAAIEQVLPSNDPLDQPNFNAVDYINTLFPTEQSLSNIDDVISKMELKIRSIDDEISTVVRGQTTSHQDGRLALEQAQRVIRQLFVQVKDIKTKAEKSEEMVREITRDIKQLDCAKRNLTAAITTLNHLHMLVGGLDSLKSLTQKRLYGEIVLPLQAISEVMAHFQNYNDIPQIQDLSQQVAKIHVELAEQITKDFHEAFAGPNAKSFVPNKQLAEACNIVSILDPKVKRDLLKWFINLQLQEYIHLFQENQDTAWLDKIDKRYAWIKRHLLEFEDKFGAMFPVNWEVSERITVEFCRITRDELSKIMQKRKTEIDIKLLLYAIQRTSNFENLLGRRFTGVTLEESSDKVRKTSQIQESAASNVPNDNKIISPFDGLIGQCFEPYLYIYVESINRNLADLIDRFVQDAKQVPPGQIESSDGSSMVLPSCADLFVFYKKCMVQCTQLSCGQSMLDLAAIFQKYLKEYAIKLLQNNLPKIGNNSQTIGSSVSSITRDLQNLSTSGLIQNFSSLLKEGDITRFTKEEQTRICCILQTAEYCLETTQQLEEKLKEKIDSAYKDQINLSQEQDIFHTVISNCIQILVQDLESACEPALIAMIKIQWQNIECVGDQSTYVNAITSHLKQTIPILRDNLSSSRKYFTQFCIKFASSFIPKFTQNIYKCKPINTVGAEQLLLDTHMLKTVLIDLPSIGSQVDRKAPPPYTKVVIKGMTKAEMILKVVMSPTDPIDSFVNQYLKLLPESQLSEFQKILDMKGLKKSEQIILIETYKSKHPGNSLSDNHTNNIDLSFQSPEHEAGRIRKLEKLIKKRLPN
ncbi:vacuolar protein sorting-associated protein 53 homolog [Chrysoperla carnea]|uniref:vacuolar protein sorting-associated protein 53 homolog n=1 Tax=Chrysoperla carnea TaxID=189513 RepID=UPI001D079467|nr:vacuolar protein sorting-associated protein 53 homolog [Chrysoperla carnea]